MSELWNKRREQLEMAASKAALDLIEHSGATAFLLDLDPPHGKLFLATGTRQSINALVAGQSDLSAYAEKFDAAFPGSLPSDIPTPQPIGEES